MDPSSADRPGEQESGSESVQPSVVRVPENVDPSQIAHFVTTIRNVEQQIGEHVIEALQYPETVAVLTTVVVGPGGAKQLVTAALNERRLQQVQEILQGAAEEREPEEPCVGFHCLIKPRRSEGTGTGEAPPPPADPPPGDAAG